MLDNEPYERMLMDMTMNNFAVGSEVLVRHGVSAWRGIVKSASPGSIVVTYPNGSWPGDDMPAREIVNLRMHRVVAA